MEKSAPRYYDALPANSAFGRAPEVVAPQRSLASHAIEAAALEQAKRQASEPVVLKAGESALRGFSTGAEDVIHRVLFDGTPISSQHDSHEIFGDAESVTDMLSQPIQISYAEAMADEVTAQKFAEYLQRQQAEVVMAHTS